MNVTTRTVLKAMSLFGGIQVLTLVCGMVRVKFVALMLGASGVGLFAVFNTALSMLTLATQLGLRTTAVREVAGAAGEEAGPAVSVVRRWGRWLGLLGGLVTLISAPLLSYFTFGDLSYCGWYLFLIPAVALAACTSADQAILQGLKKLKPLAQSSVWGAVTGLVFALPLLWLWGMDAIVPVVVLYVFTSFIATIWYVRKELPRAGGDCNPDVRQAWTRGQTMLRLGGYMSVAGVCNEVVNYVFIAYLTHAGGTEQVGVYQAGYTVMSRYVGILLSAVAVEYYPRLAASNGSVWRQRVFVSHESRLLLRMLVPLLIVLALLAPIVIRILYSTEFLEAVAYIRFAAPGILFQAYAFCIAYLMIARGHGGMYALTEFVSAVTGLGVNIAGYHFGGVAGLGISFTLNYILYAVMMRICSKVISNK